MRKSGILAHPTSFPSKYGVGDLGKGAYEFVDFLKKSEQKLWQVLPMGPTGYGDSPYQSFSTYAGNPYFIDIEDLYQLGYLDEDDLKYMREINYSDNLDYEQLYAQALELLYHNERYWFDSEEEAIMTESNREFEQSPAIEQLFMVYYRGAEEEEEGEWLLAIDILRRIQKASKMTFSARQASYFGRILQRLGVKSRRKTYGTYYLSYL